MNRAARKSVWKRMVLVLASLLGLLGILMLREQCLVNFLVAEGNLKLLRIGVERGMNVNENCKGVYPIIVAVQSRRVLVVQYLLSKSANVNIHDRELMTPLMWAAEQGEMDITHDLIAAGGDVNAIDHLGATALWYAVRTGNYDITEMLIKAGAGVNSANVDGKTPLMLARAAGNTRLVELLLRNGAK